MGKIVNISPMANREDNLQEIVDGLQELKDALVEVLDQYEKEGAEEKADALTEALDALEDAYDVISDVVMDEITYFGNENLMHHVWDNLIGNAIKFSPEKGTITIRLYEKDKQILFTVEDEGPGFSEDVRNRLFDKFYQEDSSHKQEGNGLGLALVKRILTISKGSITVENKAEGGCKFTVILDVE